MTGTWRIEVRSALTREWVAVAWRPSEREAWGRARWLRRAFGARVVDVRVIRAG